MQLATSSCETRLLHVLSPSIQGAGIFVILSPDLLCISKTFPLNHVHRIFASLTFAIQGLPAYIRNIWNRPTWTCSKWMVIRDCSHNILVSCDSRYWKSSLGLCPPRSSTNSRSCQCTCLVPDTWRTPISAWTAWFVSTQTRPRLFKKTSVMSLPCKSITNTIPWFMTFLKIWNLQTIQVK